MSEDPQPNEQAEIVSCGVGLTAALQSLKGVGSKSYVEVLRSSSTETQIRMTLRIHDTASWLRALELILKEEGRVSQRTDNWQLHVCRRYLYDEESSKLKFAWSFIVNSQNLGEAENDLCRLLDIIATNVVFVPAPSSSSHNPGSVRTPNKIVLGPTPDNQIFDNGVQMEDGQVTVMPLLGKANRNVPEGSLFEKGRSQKGAHRIK